MARRVSPPTITRRADFLRANRGLRVSTPGFALLVHPNEEADGRARVGFTVTKKIGNAVVRNRMKRRLRALARETLPALGLPGHDHVLIGRSGGVERDYADDARRAGARARTRGGRRGRYAARRPGRARAAP